MREAIKEEVSVVMYYSAKKREALPWLISWQNKDYAVGKIGYYHKVKTSDTLHHIFELVDKENAQSGLDSGQSYQHGRYRIQAE